MFCITVIFVTLVLHIMCMEYAHTIRLDTHYCCSFDDYKCGEVANFGVCMFLTCVLNSLTDFDEM